MERALVIFESMFGNTRMIAEAVAEGLASRFVTDVTEVSLRQPVSPTMCRSSSWVGRPTHSGSLVHGPARMRRRRRTGPSSLRRMDSASGSRQRSSLDLASTLQPSTHVSTSRACRDPPQEAQRNVSVVSGSEPPPRRRAST